MRKHIWVAGLLGVVGCEAGAWLQPASEAPPQPPPGSNGVGDGAARAAGLDARPSILLSPNGGRVGGRGPLTADTAPEDCSNLLDDDGDGLVDCEDPDCSASCAAGSGNIGAPCTASSDCSANGSNAPSCLTEADFGFPGGYCSQLCPLADPTSCGGDAVCLDVGLGASGVCFDGCAVDGDCAHGACVSAFAVDPLQSATVYLCYPYEKTCTGGLDEDGDGAIDCDDWDCFGTAACVAGTCGAGAVYPSELPPGGVIGAPDTYALAGSCVGLSGVEQVFVFTAPASHTYLVNVSSPADVGVYVLTDCADAGTELQCADAFGAGAAESLEFGALEGSTYYVVVDGVTGADLGSFSLEISLPAE